MTLLLAMEEKSGKEEEKKSPAVMLHHNFEITVSFYRQYYLIGFLGLLLIIPYATIIPTQKKKNIDLFYVRDIMKILE